MILLLATVGMYACCCIWGWFVLFIGLVTGSVVIQNTYVGYFSSWVSRMILHRYTVNMNNNNLKTGVAYVLSISTNIVTSGLIAGRIWEHKRLITRAFGARARRIEYYNMALHLTINSGAVYTLFLTGTLIARYTNYAALNVMSPAVPHIAVCFFTLQFCDFIRHI